MQGLCIFKKAMFLSLVIPTYNEEDRIGKSLQTIVEYLSEREYSWEIIVSDDGSSDNTKSVVEKFPAVFLDNGMNRGKGAAVRSGMLRAQGSVRVFTDADLSTPIYELEKMLPLLANGADVVIGSRRVDPSLVKIHQPWYREKIGQLGNALVRAVLFDGIEDTQCGFKGCTAQTAESLFSVMKIDGFAFDMELLYLAKKSNLRVEQIPVEWHNDDRSKVDPIRDSIKTLKEMFMIKRLHK